MYPKSPRMNDLLVRGVNNNCSEIGSSTGIVFFECNVSSSASTQKGLYDEGEGQIILNGHTVCNEKNGNYSYHGIKTLLRLQDFELFSSKNYDIL